MARKSGDFLLGQLVESVKSMENRVAEIKTHMCTGFAAMTLKLDGTSATQDKRIRRLELWRAGIVAVLIFIGFLLTATGVMRVFS